MRGTRRVIKNASAISVGLVAFVLTTSALAQEGFDVQRFTALPSQTTNYFTLSSARVLPSGAWELGMLGNYADDPLVLVRADGERFESVVGHQATIDFMAALGVGGFFDFGIAIPMILSQGGDDTSRISLNASDAAFGIGDIRVVPRFQIYNSDTDESPGGVAFGALINGFVPIGEQSNFQGENFRMEPRLVFDIIAQTGTRFSFNVGYMVREPTTLATLEVDDSITYGVAADIVATDIFHVVPELSGATAVMADDFGSEESPLEAILGFKIFAMESVLVQFGSGIGLVDGFGTPDFRLFLGVAGAVVPPRDTDLDGLFDDVDQCIDSPEDFDDFEDTDGCPDVDNDEDGILDVYDGCPLDPEDIDNFEDQDGCPDLDNDNDTILDVDDECPIDPEDLDGWEDIEGCPDYDNDGDGILDVDDGCPDDPEDFDSWEDDDGCPDPDNDEDTILDGDDDCPNDPETWNAFEDEDGCPDEGLIEVIACESINIADKVYFETGSDVIRSRSFELLNTIATLLHSRPDLLLVRIEGHTDSDGTDSYNLDLSQRRADSVVRYLLAQGITPDRLIGVGFGEERPIDTNDTRAGRAMNRRVEFHIVQQEGCD